MFRPVIGPFSGWCLRYQNTAAVKCVTISP